LDNKISLTPGQIYRAEYYQRNKHKWKERAIIYRERKNQLSREHRARWPERNRLRSIGWVESNFDWNLWSQAKRRAKRENIEFIIERSDVIIPEKCPYLDVPLTKVWGKGRLQTNASIDRIDNSKGYVKGNIQVISLLANTMKNNSTKEELITFAKNVLRLEGRFANC
jgi:hypothetical protein